ncbi:MAG TPA: energy transducer TonB [Pyrinomonadaceae bacterium]|jgi:TonB family protein
MKLRAVFIFALLFLCTPAPCADARTSARRVRLAVLDFGETDNARRLSDQFSKMLSADAELLMVDRDEARAAARGIGYSGSLNMTLAEARDLGAAIGCDFYLTGDAQSLRRSPSDAPVYYEAYASVFLVSARTGRLRLWERQSFRAETMEAAWRLLLASFESRETLKLYTDALRRAEEDERRAREMALVWNAPLIEEVPEEGSAAAASLRVPQPFRRLRPVYTEAAARAEVEATVDLLVDIDAAGEVARVEVVRWAGFGLDEASVDAVRRMHFRPAMRQGLAIPLRVLLRYNFRKPPKEEKR